jgi:hypothetical protein
MTGVEVVAEYIRRFWADARRDLTRKLASMGLSPDTMNVHFAFSVPAVWQEDAVVRMREAVEASGVRLTSGAPADIDFVLEPEAAAIAVLPRQQRDFKVCGHNSDSRLGGGRD